MRCPVQHGERSKTVRSSRMSSSVVWDRRDALRVEECEISAACFDRYKSIQERSKRYFITGIYRPKDKLYNYTFKPTIDFHDVFVVALSHNCYCFYDVFCLLGTHFVLICRGKYKDSISELSKMWNLNCSGQAAFSIWSINSSIF